MNVLLINPDAKQMGEVSSRIQADLVVGRESVADALDVLASTKFDVVILDCLSLSEPLGTWLRFASVMGDARVVAVTRQEGLSLPNTHMVDTVVKAVNHRVLTSLEFRPPGLIDRVGGNVGVEMLAEIVDECTQCLDILNGMPGRQGDSFALGRVI